MTKKDHNALLLQVMAHDLLAPLTAVKWQLELLEKGFKDGDKREKYFKGLAESTELGIALSKHAHVAGKVLSHSYEGDGEQVKLSNVIQQAVSDLHLQYERHALILRADIEEDVAEQSTDIALTKLYVWSVAKFFLTCALPQTVVSMTGARGAGDLFIFTASAENIPDAEKCIQSLTAPGSDAGALDQMSVFSKLIAETASILKVTMETGEDSGMFFVRSTFA